MDTVIRCLGCQSVFAQGGELTLTDDQVKAQAVHNPGCSINRPNIQNIVQHETTADKSIYTIVVFAAYTGD